MEARDNQRGIPQDSPISPLLANLYVSRFVLGWKKLGLERSLGSRIVTYADDLVILCRRDRPEQDVGTRKRDGLLRDRRCMFRATNDLDTSPGEHAGV